MSASDTVPAGTLVQVSEGDSLASPQTNGGDTTAPSVKGAVRVMRMGSVSSTAELSPAISPALVDGATVVLVAAIWISLGVAILRPSWREQAPSAMSEVKHASAMKREVRAMR